MSIVSLVDRCKPFGTSCYLHLDEEDGDRTFLRNTRTGPQDVTSQKTVAFKYCLYFSFGDVNRILSAGFKCAIV
jgi:hypothetical protein